MRRWSAAIILLFVTAAPRVARADYNLVIYQLGDPGTDPSSPANQRFRMLGNELGTSLSGAVLEPAETLGADGFAFDFEYTFALINASQAIQGQPFWVTASPNPGLLMLPSLHFRKGLPYSLEIGGKVDTLTNSGLFAGTAEVRWGIVEGFTYLPDLMARFAMTRLFGQQDMDVTTGVLGLSIGKQFGVAGMATLAPYAGYQAIGIDSSSRVLLTNQAQITQENYAKCPAGNVNGGAATCQPPAGDPTFTQALFNENQPFGAQPNLYNDLYLGLQFQTAIVTLALEYAYDWAMHADGIQNAEPLQQLSLSAGLAF